MTIECKQLVVLPIEPEIKPLKDNILLYLIGGATVIGLMLSKK